MFCFQHLPGTFQAKLVCLVFLFFSLIRTAHPPPRSNSTRNYKLKESSRIDNGCMPWPPTKTLQLLLICAILATMSCDNCYHAGLLPSRSPPYRSKINFSFKVGSLLYSNISNLFLPNVKILTSVKLLLGAIRVQLVT